MFKRVVIKLSGEALAGDTDKSFDDVTIERIVEEIKTVISKGIQVSLIVGGGNFWRGRSSDSKMDRVKADQIGMMATIMNAIYVADKFKQKSINAVVMTPFTVGAVTELFSKDRALELLEKGSVLIFAGGTGHPFFSTDTITAIRAAELEADAILFAKNVNGIYDSDPHKNSAAKKYDEITYREIIYKDLQAIDIAAISLCEQQNITSVVFGLNEQNSIQIAAEGDNSLFSVGTLVKKVNASQFKEGLLNVRKN